MALSWDITQCADPELLQSDEEWAKTEALIWFTMMAGLHTSPVSAADAADWYARMAFWERLHGPWVGFYGEDGNRVDDPFTPEDIQRRIGLRTNGNFKKEAWSTWVRRITKRDEEDAKRKFRRFIEEQEAAA